MLGIRQVLRHVHRLQIDAEAIREIEPGSINFYGRIFVGVCPFFTDETLFRPCLEPTSTPCVTVRKRRERFIVQCYLGHLVSNETEA